MIDRRTLLVAGACSLGAPSTALAQASAGKRRIAYLVPSSAATTQHMTSAFRSGPRDLGWIEGDNLILDMRFAENDPSRVVSLTAELLALEPGVFVSGTDREARAAAAATLSIPIVFPVGVDPVGLGLVSSLGRPGANVTGFSTLASELTLKRLSLLKEAVPGLETVGVLFRDGEPSNAAVLDALETAARQLRVKLLPAGVRSADDLEAAFERIASGRANGVLNVAHSLFFQHRQRLADLAITARALGIEPPRMLVMLQPTRVIE